VISPIEITLDGSMMPNPPLVFSSAAHRFPAFRLSLRNVLTVIRFQLAGSILILSFLFFCGVAARETFTLDASILDAAEKRFGADARQRLLDWQQFIRDDDSNTDLEKLEKVNSFFNKLTFVSDEIHWQKNDYWATPIEFLASNGGDCEDFALAKYFTLKVLGVPEKKMHMTYVKAWKLNQSHMVVTYYETPAAEPLVLDNLINAIEPGSKRTDLLPVYSFNGTGLWLAQERGRGNLIGKSDRLKLWNDLLDRMPAGLN
jgi:predicted transglutaminase-like cysteine proteinase